MTQTLSVRLGSKFDDRHRIPTNGVYLISDQNIAAEEAYLIMKAIQYNFKKHIPRADRTYFPRFIKNGKQFKSKGKRTRGKGKGRNQFRRNVFNSKFKDNRQGKGNRGKANSLGKDGQPLK